jgi:hypothetical protein
MKIKRLAVTVVQYFTSQIYSGYDFSITYDAPASSSDAGVSGSSSLYIFSAICQTYNRPMKI